MCTGVLSIDDYEIKIWSTLKNIEDIPYPAETNIQPKFIYANK